MAKPVASTNAKTRDRIDHGAIYDARVEAFNRSLDDIARTGEPEGGRGWTPHSQRRLDSLVRRGLVKYEGDRRWELAEEHVPEDAEAKRWWEEDEELWT